MILFNSIIKPEINFEIPTNLNYFEFYSAEDGYIEEIFFSSGDNIKRGQLLLKIKSPLIEHKISQVQKEIELIKIEISRQAGFRENLNKRFILEESLSKKINELDGLKKIVEKFEIKAPFDGKIYLNDSYKINQWISKKNAIFFLYDNLNYKIVGFCNENNSKLLKENSEAKFIFNSGDIKDINTKITTMSKVSIPYLEFSELSSDFGGEIATRNDLNKLIKTEQAYYKVIIDLNENITLDSRKSGTLVTNGESSSLISSLYKKTLSVIIRESEF